MDQGAQTVRDSREEQGGMSGGFCSASCVDKDCIQRVVHRPDLKTSDLFHTCNLPKRFEHPHWFNGYGSQTNKQHPFYRTTASEYGWYPPGDAARVHYRILWMMVVYGVVPGFHSVPNVFYPAGQKFTNQLAAAGMYRNYSLNTGMDQPSFK